MPLLLVLQAAEGRTAKRRKGPTGAAIPAEDAGPPAEDAVDARADPVEVTAARLLCDCHAMWTLTCFLGWSCRSASLDGLCSNKPLLLCICSPRWVDWRLGSKSGHKAIAAVTVHVLCPYRILSLESGADICEEYGCCSCVQAPAP